MRCKGNGKARGEFERWGWPDLLWLTAVAPQSRGDVAVVLVEKGNSAAASLPIPFALLVVRPLLSLSLSLSEMLSEVEVWSGLEEGNGRGQGMTAGRRRRRVAKQTGSLLACWEGSGRKEDDRECRQRQSIVCCVVLCYVLILTWGGD